MKVAGIEITPEQIEALERAMWHELADPRGHTWYHHIAARAVVYEGIPGLSRWLGDAIDRLLQRERKAGRIRHIGGGKWQRVEASDGE